MLRIRNFYLNATRFAPLAILLGACGQSQPQQAAPPPIKVSVIRPVEKEITEWDEYTGRLQSPESVEIRPRVGGYLQSINFKDGQMVKKGELLFVIDPRPYEAEVDRAQSNLEQAQAQAQLASTNLKRSKELQQKQVIAQQELDSRSNDYKGAEASIGAAQAALATAKLNLEFTHVMSPIDGRVSRYTVSVGNLVGENTLLTTVVSLDPLYGYFQVDEQSFLKYASLPVSMKKAGPSDSASPASAEGMRVEMKIGEEEGFPHAGQLDFVDNRVDIATSTVELRGVFPNSDFKLIPGLFARVRIPAREKYKAILVPDDAIGTNQSSRFVYTVTQDNKAQLRQVELGPIDESNLRVIRKGVTPQDAVIVSGLLQVKPDSLVQPEEAPITKTPETSATPKQDDSNAPENPATSR